MAGVTSRRSALLGIFLLVVVLGGTLRGPEDLKRALKLRNAIFFAHALQLRFLPPTNVFPPSALVACSRAHLLSTRAADSLMDTLVGNIGLPLYLSHTKF